MSHCVYKKCKKCGDEYCARGCSYTCECGEEVEYTKEELAEERKKLNELYAALPEGWF